jgi:hypothetical protein
MEEQNAKPWLQLFQPPEEGARRVDTVFRLVERRGEPLLLLPEDSALATAGLELYPAQTFKARAAKAALKLMLRAGGGAGTRHATLALNPASGFLHFLGGGPIQDKPAPFAVLFGNARTIGRRFIVLAFGADGTPSKVVKAGTNTAAAELVRHEQNFLQEAPTGRIRAPKLLGCFRADRVEAIALEYIPGQPPGQDECRAIAPLLTSWVSNDESMPLTSLATWSRLASAAGESPLLAKLMRIFANQPVRTAIHHGDFAPWNIRITPATNAWHVLDWERGELSGPPAWDWYHFEIQPLLLVKKLKVPSLADEVERMLDSDSFGAYAAAANIREVRRPLLLAYLLYCRDVLKPSEGRTETSALLELLLGRWAGLLD